MRRRTFLIEIIEEDLKPCDQETILDEEIIEVIVNRFGLVEDLNLSIQEIE